MQRLDLLLVERDLCQSRTHAQRLIKNKRVRAKLDNSWQSMTKPGLKLPEDVELQVEQDDADQYASRGALKLIKGLETCGLDVTGLIAIDVGQSTGGFTDCLLQQGAAHVVGIEVGHDQLAQKLREDSRVTCYEDMNARALPESLLTHTNNGGFDLAVMDVSFISQTKILPSLTPLLKPGATLISLVKPQFEVGKEGIGRGGIVRDENLYPKVEAMIKQHCQQLGLEVSHYTESPIKGGDGNREFLICATRTTTDN